MSRQKAATRACRELRRSLRKESRSSRLKEINNVASFADFTGIETIGMACETRDRSPIIPRSEAQRKYIEAIKWQKLILANGEAGCGKTFISSAMAADALINKEINKIIVTRPVLQAEEDLGFLPGDMAEKFAPFFRSVYDILAKRLGHSFLQYCLRPEIGKVEIAPFAYMCGRTFENAFVIVDEAQNVTANQMKMFLTRLGENVTVVVNGDVSQCDLPLGIMSGLEDALRRFDCDDLVTIVKFTIGDCVRSELCHKALLAYEL